MNKVIAFLGVSFDNKKIIKKEFSKALINNNINDLANVEILCISANNKIDNKFLAKLPKLKYIITRSVGYDHIDLKACLKRKIKVSNISDYGSSVIAEFVFALLLSGLRNIDLADKYVEKNYRFDKKGLTGIALENKTIGIIGLGNIGSKVARIASLGFHMNTIVYTPNKKQKLAKQLNFKYVTLNKLWNESDIISLHCPLNEKTRHLINSKSIKKMKDNVVIVNTSRGGLINTKDLTKAILSKKVSRSFLDVIEHEDNILKNKKLIDIPEVIVTPHIAYYADDSSLSRYKLSFKAILAYINNKKLPDLISGI